MNIHWSETVSSGKTENHNNILCTQINEIALWKGENLGSIFFSIKQDDEFNLPLSRSAYWNH